MTRRHWFAAALALVGVAACQGDAEPRKQWLVTISTDAQPPRFGDRLVVEVLQESGEPACSACRRTFDAHDASAFPLSFGITPTSGAQRLLLRARLYRAVYGGPDGLPAGPTLIDASGFLPDQPGPVHVALTMGCFGVGDDDPTTTCDLSSGALAPAPELSGSTPLPAPGTWPPGRSVDCPGAPPKGMVCMPGGAFLLGAADAPPSSIELLPLPERLVQVSPFFLDVDEVRVGDVRAIAASLPTLPKVQSAGTDARVDCTYRGDDQNNALPVNCVDHALAMAICDRLEKRLPTEAEWEYAATAGGEGPERTFPWGEDEAVCDHAVVSAGVTGNPIHDRSCLAGDTLILPGLREGGHDADRTPLGIANLGGNLAEWLQDDFAPYTDPCWSDVSLLDPTCQIAINLGAAARGGTWTLPRVSAHSSSRRGQLKTSRISDVGLRCAKSAQ